MIFDSIDSNLKQAVKIFNELKNNDIKLREGFIYTNEMLDNFSKVAISNNLLLSKLKKLDKPVSLSYNMKKYKCFIPVLEIK